MSTFIMSIDRLNLVIIEMSGSRDPQRKGGEPPVSDSPRVWGRRERGRSRVEGQDMELFSLALLLKLSDLLALGGYLPLLRGHLRLRLSICDFVVLQGV